MEYVTHQCRKGSMILPLKLTNRGFGHCSIGKNTGFVPELGIKWNVQLKTRILINWFHNSSTKWAMLSTPWRKPFKTRIPTWLCLKMASLSPWRCHSKLLRSCSEQRQKVRPRYRHQRWQDMASWDISLWRDFLGENQQKKTRDVPLPRLITGGESGSDWIIFWLSHIFSLYVLWIGQSPFSGWWHPSFEPISALGSSQKCWH